WLLRKADLPARGLYPVLTVALALLAFAVPTVIYGSGFLAVYLAAVILGNGRIPDRAGLARVHDSLAWFCQIGMFLLLGLLVFPSRLPVVAGVGVVTAAVLTLVARPLAVFACLLPFRYPWKEVLYIAWAGLRGAVPIVLAIFPVLARAPEGQLVFNVVFFVVVVNAIIPGTTIRAVTRWLGLQTVEPPSPHAVLEIASAPVLSGDVMSYYIDP